MIAMTPLVDIVFLLLTFFMLSSQFSPFALLPLGTPLAGGADPAIPPPSGGNGPGIAADLLVSVGKESLKVNGVSVAVSDLAAMLGKARDGGAQTVAILASDTASVQDLVTVLEAAKAAAMTAVSVANFR